MDRDVALLCNPSAGGGRAARVLPQVEEALGSHRIAFHTETTRDLDHARALAGAAAAAGEVVVTLGGDGLVGCVAGALREAPGSVLGVLPGGRGNDLARSLRIPRDPRAACAVIADGTERLLDIGDVGGRTFVGIASLGFDSDANRIANAAPSRLGSLVYVYAALRALAAWQPARFELTLDGETRRVHRLFGRRRERPRLRRRDAARSRRPPRRRALRRRPHRPHLQAPVSRGSCRRSSRARTSTSRPAG